MKGEIEIMNVYLVRHGQTNHNLKKYYSNEDEDLNATGIAQAKELCEKMKKEQIPYEVVITSPLLRARHTAELINYQGAKIIVDKRLTERNPGNLNGCPLSSTNREEYWNLFSKVQYGTSEPITELLDRVYSLLDELAAQKYENVLIVGHSGVSKAFYTYFNGVPKDGSLLDKGLKNTEVKEYTL